MALKDLVVVMAKALVDHPEQVEVEEIDGDREIVLELHVAKDDIGKVIGREGRTAQSMRAIVQAAATKLGGRRAHLDIRD